MNGHTNRHAQKQTRTDTQRNLQRIATPLVVHIHLRVRAHVYAREREEEAGGEGERDGERERKGKSVVRHTNDTSLYMLAILMEAHVNTQVLLLCSINSPHEFLDSLLGAHAKPHMERNAHFLSLTLFVYR